MTDRRDFEASRLRTNIAGDIYPILLRPLRLLALFIVVVGAVFAWSCTRNAENHSPPLARVKLQLDWKVGSEHAFLVAGAQQGLFRREGIDVEILPGTGSASSANMVDAKSVDVALCSADSELQAIVGDPPRRTRTVAVFYPNTPTVIYSRVEKNIRRPDDLYGKRLGVMKGSSASRVYEAFARKLRLDEKRITLVPVTGDIREVVADRPIVDAMVHFGFQHPLQAQVEGFQVTVLPIRDYGINIYGQGLIVHEDTIRQKPDLVRSITKAVQWSYLRSIQDPGNTLSIFFEKYPEQKSRYAELKFNWVTDFVASGAKGGHPIGFQSADMWRATRDFVVGQGLTIGDEKLSAAWTNQFLDSKATLQADK